MTELVSALMSQDVARLLTCFSRTRPWKLSVTAEGGGRRPTKFTYKALADGLRPGGDFRDVILGDGGDKSFRGEILEAKGSPWQAKTATTFIPPGEPRDPSVFVKWRHEGNLFVVDEIGFPF
jgi:hypothetical protein